ncbi:type II secretion system protein GspL [Endozoicomonas sp. Mp262]|uniref:type II secretion system protein GspL n=1 Tax=Endozoicomonas sp. Mp262 TaxID=2919499 RepID=UPI0021DA535A
MNPHLIIRLPEYPNQPVHWQLWPVSNTAAVGDSSGQLSAIEQLSDLNQQFGDTPTIILVPAAQITVHSVEISGKVNQTVLQSLPWRLEDEFSEDVDNLHFTVLNKEKVENEDSEEEHTRLDIAVVSDTQMTIWQHWLKQGNIVSKKWLPDALTLPWKKDTCSLLKLNNNVLIKNGPYQFGHCDPSWLDLYLDSLNSNTEGLTANALNPVCNDKVQSPKKEIEQPLTLMASEAVANKTNLLQGKWKQASPWIQKIKPWRSAAILLLATLIVAGGQSLVKTIKLEQEAQNLQAEAKAIYHKLFPGERIQVVRSQMRQKLAALQGSGESDNGFLDTMAGLQPLFTVFPELKPISLSYENNRNTLRIEAAAKDFETFTRFRDLSGEKLSDDFSVSVDAVERNGEDQVTGVLIISGKSA